MFSSVTYQLVLDQEADGLSDAGGDHVGGVGQVDGALGVAPHLGVQTVFTLVRSQRLITQSPGDLHGQETIVNHRGRKTEG